MRRYHETFRLWEYLLFYARDAGRAVPLRLWRKSAFPLSRYTSILRQNSRAMRCPQASFLPSCPSACRAFLCVALTERLLSLAGAAMQGLLKNPLADGSTLGVSSGASLGAVIAIAFGVTRCRVCPFAGTMGTAIIFAFASLPCHSRPFYKLDRSLSRTRSS